MARATSDEAARALDLSHVTLGHVLTHMKLQPMHAAFQAWCSLARRRRQAVASFAERRSIRGEQRTLRAWREHAHQSKRRRARLAVLETAQSLKRERRALLAWHDAARRRACLRARGERAASVVAARLQRDALHGWRSEARWRAAAGAKVSGLRAQRLKSLKLRVRHVSARFGFECHCRFRFCRYPFTDANLLFSFT